MIRPATLACAFLSLATIGCIGTRKLADPTLQVQTSGGTELGVSTEYGVVFLGHTARSGYVEVTAWFGDGPSIESTVIEPISAELYTAEMEIRIPTVPMSFLLPKDGETVVVAGRTDNGPWTEQVKVRSDPRVYGILLDVPSRLDGSTDQIGAGVYTVEKGKRQRKRLIGLVSGKLRLKTGGREREYLTVMGPDDLWRLVTHRRDLMCQSECLLRGP